MKPKTAKFSPGLFVLLLSFLIPIALQAQTNGATLSGSITDAAGKFVANAKISIKNLATNQSTQAETNLAGSYSVPNLSSGDYQVSVSAEGFDTKTTKITLAAGVDQTMNVTLSSGLSL